MTPRALLALLLLVGCGESPSGPGLGRDEDAGAAARHDAGPLEDAALPAQPRFPEVPRAPRGAADAPSTRPEPTPETIWALRTRTSTAFPTAELNEAYTFDVELAGGYGPLGATAEGLPPGLSLRVSRDRRLTLEGVPREAGTFDVHAHAWDASGAHMSWSSRLQVLRPLTLPAPSSADVEACAFFEREVRASGGVPPYRYSAPGTLPEDLEIEAVDGLRARVYGALAPGDYEAWLFVEDARGAMARVRWRWSATDPDPRNRWVAYARALDLGVQDIGGAFAVDVCRPRSAPPVLIGASPTTPTGGLTRSHDGRKVAFIEFIPDNLNVVDLSGPTPGPLRPVTPDGWAVDYDHHFSPDDRWIVFYTRRHFPEIGDQLYLVEVDAPNPTPRPVGLPAENRFTHRAARFSEDSRWLAFGVRQPTASPGLFVVPTEGGAPPVRVFPAPGGSDEVASFTWLPGRRLLVYHSTKQVPPVTSLSLVDASDPAAPVVTRLATRITGDPYAAFRPHDEARAYWLSATDGRLWVAYLDEVGTPVVRVPGVPPQPVNLALDLPVAPVGHAIFVAGYVVETSTTPRVYDLWALTGGARITRGIWSPDGTRLYFGAGPHGAEDTYVFDLASPSSASRWAVGAAPVRLSPDGRWLVTLRSFVQPELIDTTRPSAPARVYPVPPTSPADLWTNKGDRHMFKLDSASLLPLRKVTPFPTQGWLYRMNLYDSRPLEAELLNDPIPNMYLLDTVVGACVHGQDCP